MGAITIHASLVRYNGSADEARLKETKRPNQYRITITPKGVYLSSKDIEAKQIGYVYRLDGAYRVAIGGNGYSLPFAYRLTDLEQKLNEGE